VAACRRWHRDCRRCHGYVYSRYRVLVASLCLPHSPRAHSLPLRRRLPHPPARTPPGPRKASLARLPAGPQPRAATPLDSPPGCRLPRALPAPPLPSPLRRPPRGHCQGRPSH
jgi:hypothetical protein